MRPPSSVVFIIQRLMPVEYQRFIVIVSKTIRELSQFIGVYQFMFILSP